MAPRKWSSISKEKTKNQRRDERKTKEKPYIKRINI